jgi:hypothetical protein|nr:MAG: hypothetical protein [Caudoviricetes sp.]
MIGYKNLSDKELRQLLESNALEEYEKLDILNELIQRGTVEFVREEWIH